MADSNFAAASGLIDEATKLITTASTKLGQLRKSQVNSVTAATAEYAIRARAWVDRDIAHHDIARDIMKAAFTMYAGMTLTVLQMNSLVTSSRTVSDSLSSVRTNSMEAVYNDLGVKLDGLLGSIEAIEGTPAKEDDSDGKPKAVNDIDADDITQAPPDILPTGKIIEVTLTAPGGTEQIKVPLLIQITPYLVNPATMAFMVGHGAGLSFKQRWLQWRAGEISFFSDLIFQTDRLKKLEHAVRSDDTGAYGEFLKEVGSKDKFTLNQELEAHGAENAMRSSNIANSIFIISEDTARQAKLDGHVDLNNPGSRARFFRNTYVMMLFVVDTNFDSVKLYMNGVRDVGEYSFSQFQAKKKGGDAVDIVALMTAISQGRAAHF